MKYQFKLVIASLDEGVLNEEPENLVSYGGVCEAIELSRGEHEVTPKEPFRVHREFEPDDEVKITLWGCALAHGLGVQILGDK